MNLSSAYFFFVHVCVCVWVLATNLWVIFTESDFPNPQGLLAPPTSWQILRECFTTVHSTASQASIFINKDKGEFDIPSSLAPNFPPHVVPTDSHIPLIVFEETRELGTHIL